MKIIMLDCSLQKILVFDTETTGIPSSFDKSEQVEHEILQLSMINGEEQILFNEYFKPSKHTTWSESETITGITPQMLGNKSSIENYIKIIQSHIDAADLLVAYNFRFDYIFLRSVGIKFIGKRYCDVMVQYAFRQGKRRRYVSLQACAKQLGYSFDDAHSAVTDAKATLYCFLKLNKNVLT
jgi:DNA polymerase III epsilon subunit-like protein